MNDAVYGIMLGIGIPYSILVFIVLRNWFCPNCLRANSPRRFSKNPEKAIRKELSPTAFHDFKRGMLTTQVYKEIMYIYNQKKSLNDYIVVASKYKYEHILLFLSDPTTYPMPIHVHVHV